MHWFFHINIGNIRYTLKAERLFINKQIEQIKITGEGVSIVVESNRPLIDDLGLNREVNWKIIKGKLKDGDALTTIIKALEESLKNYK
jgi:hypothetical protein